MQEILFYSYKKLSKVKEMRNTDIWRGWREGYIFQLDWKGRSNRNHLVIILGRHPRKRLSTYRRKDYRQFMKSWKGYEQIGEMMK